MKCPNCNSNLALVVGHNDVFYCGECREYIFELDDKNKNKFDKENLVNNN